MCPRALVIALAAVAALACSRDRRVTPASSVSPNAPSTFAVPSVPPASASAALALPARSAVPEPAAAHCLSADERDQDVAVSFKLRGELAVVRVAPDDVLWLRQGPGAKETPTGKLAHDARRVAPTGHVCRTGETTWYEVSSGSARGFANGRFLEHTTEPADETARFAKLLGSAGFASLDALIEALRQALKREQTEPSEVRFDPSLVGVARSGARALVVLHACCYADDSVMGEQISFEALERNGRWTLARARASRLCPRGTSGAACT
jgi:hypothetical protein